MLLTSFCSEDVLAQEKARAVEEALYERRVMEVLERGEADFAAGRVFHGVAEARAESRKEAWSWLKSKSLKGFVEDMTQVYMDSKREEIWYAVSLLEFAPEMGSRILPTSIKRRFGDTVRKVVVDPFDISTAILLSRIWSM